MSENNLCMAVSRNTWTGVKVDRPALIFPAKTAPCWPNSICLIPGVVYVHLVRSMDDSRALSSEEETSVLDLVDAGFQYITELKYPVPK